MAEHELLPCSDLYSTEEMQSQFCKITFHPLGDSALTCDVLVPTDWEERELSVSAEIVERDNEWFVPMAVLGPQDPSVFLWLLYSRVPEEIQPLDVIDRLTVGNSECLVKGVGEFNERSVADAMWRYKPGDDEPMFNRVLPQVAENLLVRTCVSRRGEIVFLVLAACLEKDYDTWKKVFGLACVSFNPCGEPGPPRPSNDLMPYHNIYKPDEPQPNFGLLSVLPGEQPDLYFLLGVPKEWHQTDVKLDLGAATTPMKMMRIAEFKPEAGSKTKIAIMQMLAPKLDAAKFVDLMTGGKNTTAELLGRRAAMYGGNVAHDALFKIQGKLGPEIMRVTAAKIGDRVFAVGCSTPEAEYDEYKKIFGVAVVTFNPLGRTGWDMEQQRDVLMPTPDDLSENELERFIRRQLVPQGKEELYFEMVVPVHWGMVDLDLPPEITEDDVNNAVLIADIKPDAESAVDIAIYYRRVPEFVDAEYLVRAFAEQNPSTELLATRATLFYGRDTREAVFRTHQADVGACILRITAMKRDEFLFWSVCGCLEGDYEQYKAIFAMAAATFDPYAKPNTVPTTETVPTAEMNA